MNYPILDGQQNIGTLSVREDGLYRILSARLDDRPGVQRLWLCGRAGHVCLGVLLPAQGMLTLQKRLSRAAWDALPHPLLYAALAEPLSVPQEQPAAAVPAVTETAPSDDPPRCIRLFGARFVVFRS